MKHIFEVDKFSSKYLMDFNVVLAIIQDLFLGVIFSHSDSFRKSFHFLKKVFFWIWHPCPYFTFVYLESGMKKLRYVNTVK